VSNGIARSNPTDQPTVLFFGRPCRLSTLPLRALLEAGITVVAIVVPTRRHDEASPIRPRSLPPLVLTPASGEPTLEQLASQNRIPLLEANTLQHPQVRERLDRFEPDLLVVSCFPWRIPEEIVTLAPLGGLNVHPSALPAYRGPDPLFWIYRHGRLRTGVTVHQLTAEFDAGPIVEQAVFDLPLGLPGDRLERQAAGIGGTLLIRAIRALSERRARPLPQSPERSSYFSWPHAEDLEIGPEWPAWRAVHFLNGVLPLGYRPVYVAPCGQRIVVRRVLRWYRTTAEADSYARSFGATALPLRDAVLVAKAEGE
jgi:methionyl-tRNA formyltransferase